MQKLGALLALLAGLHGAVGARTNLRHGHVSIRSVGTGNMGAVGGGADRASGKTQSHAEVRVGAMMAKMVRGDPVMPRDIMKASEKMDLNEAVSKLDGQLPADVASLVRLSTSSGAKAGADFAESSLQKARRILNGMIESSYREFDILLLECTEFHARNRGTMKQVVADLARFASQLAKLGEERVVATEGIQEEDRSRKEVEEDVENERREYTTQRLEDEAEMTTRKNDLAVFDFILELVKCKEESSLVQLSATTAQRAPSFAPAAPHICRSKGGIGFHFDDPVLQAKVERMMTPSARQALRKALGEDGAAALLQLDHGQAMANATTSAIPTYAQEETAVQEEPNPLKQWKKCVDGPYNCGLLHDIMSLQWGKFRDAYDKLKDIMNERQTEHDKLMALLNEELVVINDRKTTHMDNLAEAVSNIDAVTEEQTEKTEEKTELSEEYAERMHVCVAKLSEIWDTNICAVRKVRNVVMRFSTTSPTENIQDCEVSEFTADQCQDMTGDFLPCDDSCPKQDPYKCGGFEVITRMIVVVNNTYGYQCPVLKMNRKCNQRKCPVDCVLSQWSGWSSCSAVCGFGSQSQTRAVITKAKNGGEQCDTVQEERNCNSFSCYRDCHLSEWSDWGFCSMACALNGEGGRRVRRKSVVLKERGGGTCPKRNHYSRRQTDDCNMNSCYGDEVCIAQQDLIIALDASGSLREEGFKVLQDFAANLTTKYKFEFFGMPAMRVGVTLFGNGEVITLPGGSATTISPALNIVGLTANMDHVREKILATTWQKGFTNMAQAFIMADTMLQQFGRPEAQSAVLVISDGKYSFKYQTAQKAKELKDKNVMLYMSPVSDTDDKSLKTIRNWASKPRASSYERIPGLEVLKYNGELFAQRIVSKFCPDAISMKELIRQENERAYLLLHENGWPSNSCGEWVWLGVQPSRDECALAARAQEKLAFSFGRSYAANGCYAEAVHVTVEKWLEWQQDRTDPPCPDGYWINNPYYDTYVLKPLLGVGESA